MACIINNVHVLRSLRQTALKFMNAIVCVHPVGLSALNEVLLAYVILTISDMLFYSIIKCYVLFVAYFIACTMLHYISLIALHVIIACLLIGANKTVQ